MTTTHFFVPGHPLPKGSKGHVGNGVLLESADRKTNTRRAGGLGKWQKAVSVAAGYFVQGRKPRITQGPCAVMLKFIVPRSTSERQCRPWKHGSGDSDKLARSVLDALEGIVYRNDAQVCRLEVEKQYESDDGPGVHVTVTEL